MKSFSDFYLCGWRVSSWIPLPGLLPWQGDAREADVRIRPGVVRDDFIADRSKTAIQAGGSGALYRAWLPGAASFEIRDRDEVVVQVEPGACPLDVKTCLLGSVLGVLCHLRGLLPLHAACVRMGDGAVAFAGPSGAGKSTLGAALARLGYPLLSDDVCAVDTSGMWPSVLPSFPTARLLDSSIDAAGLAAAPECDLGSDREKRHIRFAPAEPGPVRLVAIYCLQAAASEEVGIEQSGAESLLLLNRQIFRGGIARRLGLAEAVFARASRVAATTPIRVLARRMDLSRLGETAQLMEDLHGAVAA